MREDYLKADNQEQGSEEKEIEKIREEYRVK